MSNPVHNDRIYLGDDPCFIIDRYPYDQILDSSDEGADDDDQTVPFPPTLDSSEEVSNPWTINNVGAVKSPGNGFYSPPPKRSILQEDIISPAKASASNGGLCHILLRRAQGSGAETPTSSIDSCTGTSASLAGTPYPLKRPADQCANHGHSCTEKFIYSRPSLHQTTVAEVKDKADDGRRHFWEDSDVASAKLLMGLGNANPNDHHQPCLGIQPRTEEKSTREDWIDHGYQAEFMDDGQSLWNDGGHVVESQSDSVPSLEPITEIYESRSPPEDVGPQSDSLFQLLDMLEKGLKSGCFGKRFLFKWLDQCDQAIHFATDKEVNENVEYTTEALLYIMNLKVGFLIKKALHIFSGHYDHFASSEKAHILLMKAALWVMRNVSVASEDVRSATGLVKSFLRTAIEESRNDNDARYIAFCAEGGIEEILRAKKQLSDDKQLEKSLNKVLINLFCHAIFITKEYGTEVDDEDLTWLYCQLAIIRLEETVKRLLKLEIRPSNDYVCEV